MRYNDRRVLRLHHRFGRGVRMKSQGVARIYAPRVTAVGKHGFKRLHRAVGSRACILGAHQRHDRANEKCPPLAACGAHVRAILKARWARGNVTPIRARAHAKAIN
jgi:hypothetical protein